MTTEKIAEVFKTTGQPTVTYVKRDSGKLEDRLSNALDERGQLCLVTGPSKTGKTTLYNQVLKKRGQVPLIVRCDKSRNVESLWRGALEEVDFSRVTTLEKSLEIKLEAEGELGGSLGWAWLAGMNAKFRGMLSNTSSESEIREKILSDASPALLSPILKKTNYVLVVEDFHYLEDDIKITLFQQWKTFIDDEISIIVLGTTHRAVDIANSNSDLIGRVAQIDVGHWEISDLKKIIQQGFSHLDTAISSSMADLIAQEAVGLPIIVQQTCYEIFSSKNITLKSLIPKNMRIVKAHVEQCLNNVALNKYTQFNSYYSTIISGPREKARKYPTYEIILTCFTLDPIKFALKRSEIDERITRLKLSKNQIPPAASLNSTLGALKNFQEHRNIRLLEWLSNEDKLYIIEPAFLFYVRWRKIKSIQIDQLDLFEQLIRATE